MVGVVPLWFWVTCAVGAERWGNVEGEDTDYEPQSPGRLTGVRAVNSEHLPGEK